MGSAESSVGRRVALQVDTDRQSSAGAWGLFWQWWSLRRWFCLPDHRATGAPLVALAWRRNWHVEERGELGASELGAPQRNRRAAGAGAEAELVLRHRARHGRRRDALAREEQRRVGPFRAAGSVAVVRRRRAGIFSIPAPVDTVLIKLRYFEPGGLMHGIGGVVVREGVIIPHLVGRWVLPVHELVIIEYLSWLCDSCSKGVSGIVDEIGFC